MTRVIIESPFAGDIVGNLAYARAAMRDSLERGESPIAWHLLFTQEGILRDDIAKEREWGISAGTAWLCCAELVAVYADLGITKGMDGGIRCANFAGVPITYRRIAGKRSW